MIEANTGEFIASLGRAIANTEKDLNTVARGATAELLSNVIRRSPLDDSKYADDTVMRGDWTTAVNSIPGDVNRSDPTGEAAKAEAEAAVQQWVPATGDYIAMANHKPYAQVLEYGGYPGGGPRTTTEGFSTQAPEGMVGISVEEFDGIVEKWAKKTKSGA